VRHQTVVRAYNDVKWTVLSGCVKSSVGSSVAYGNDTKNEI